MNSFSEDTSLYTAPLKVIIEYGMVAFVAFALFIGYIFCFRQRDWFISALALFSYLFLSGNLLASPIVISLLTIGPMLRSPVRPQP